jgi:hypothetical protein
MARDLPPLRVALELETAGRVVEVVLDQIAVLSLSLSAGTGVMVVMVWLFLRHRLA